MVSILRVKIASFIGRKRTLDMMRTRMANVIVTRQNREARTRSIDIKTSTSPTLQLGQLLSLLIFAENTSNAISSRQGGTFKLSLPILQ